MQLRRTLGIVACLLVSGSVFAPAQIPQTVIARLTTAPVQGLSGFHYACWVVNVGSKPLDVRILLLDPSQKDWTEGSACFQDLLQPGHACYVSASLPAFLNAPTALYCRITVVGGSRDSVRGAMHVSDIPASQLSPPPTGPFITVEAR
jgi:hypothetical protein